MQLARRLLGAHALALGRRALRLRLGVQPPLLGDLFSPVQPDYTSLGSFGSIDNVAATVLPPADFPSEMLEMASKKGSYVFDYTITAPGEPKRHLKTAYNMTPDEYRQRWGLPSDYPMVAPNYAAQRSKLAKEIGLGTRRGKK